MKRDLSIDLLKFLAVGFEVYLSHRILLTDRWNDYFPLNCFLTVVAVLLLAYVVRCAARMLRQVLGDN